MEENIELFSFKSPSKNESDIEEYHEITEDFKEKTIINSPPPSIYDKSLNEIDFFTKYDVKLHKKGNTKTKKSKKKEREEKSSNIMDIISSELASMAVPVEKNVITKEDTTHGRYSSFLEKTLISIRALQKSKRWTDAEHGWGCKSKSTDLNPVFPRVLENALKEDLTIPVQYEAPVLFTDIIKELETTDTNDTKFLDVSLSNVTFKYHYKYSLEKVLAIKLCDTYDEYKNNKIAMITLERDIKIARETNNNLKNEFLGISSKKEEVRFDKTVRKYTGELLKLKESYFEMLKAQKNLIHLIISLWSDIELVRDKAKCTKTGVILDIEKIERSTEDFENEWDEIYNVEFKDKLDQIEFEYVSKYLEYKEAKQENKKSVKPKLVIDEENIKNNIEMLVSRIAIKDHINVKLHHDNSVITDFKNFETSTNYQAFYFKVYVDDVFVCESEKFSIMPESNISIDFTEVFSVQILSGNEILCIVLVEDEREISSVKVSITNNTRDRLCNGVKEFIFNGLLEPSSQEVGNGFNMKKIASKNKVRLKSTNVFRDDLVTTCLVDVKMEWNEKLSQNNGDSIKSFKAVEKQISRMLHGIDKPDIESLKVIINKLYGRDFDDDEKIIKKLKEVCQESVKSNDDFEVDENSILRYKLLRLRNNSVMGDVNDTTIPLFASQVSTEQLNCLQMYTEKEFDVQSLTDKQDMDAIEVQRFIGSKYVQKLNKNLMKNLREHLLKKTSKDVVRDFKDLSFRGLFSNESSLTSLTTLSESTKHCQRILKESLMKEQEIQVTVNRAFNLHDRQATIMSDEQDDDDDKIAGFKVRPLRPFVVVSYREVSAQTTTAIGCHPTWNQTMKIRVKPDPLTSLHINIFDEHKQNISECSDDDRSFHSKTVHYRYFNKWLGSVQLPLYSVLTSGMIRGTFKITTPPLLLGYETLAPNKNTPKSLIPEVNQLLKKDSSFLTLQITTSLLHLGGTTGYRQPILNDDNYLLKHLNQFVTEYTNDFPTRNLTLTFIDSCSNNKCVTQFLQPLPLPDFNYFPKNPKARSESALSKSSGLSKSSSSKSSLRKRDLDRSPLKSDDKESVYRNYDNWRSAESDLSKLMNVCVRYVALIPTYELTESHAVTLMGMELLKVLYGSPLDHTLLLASYFLYLGIRTWVVTGYGLTRGLTSYVLTQYDINTRRMTLTSDDSKRSMFSRSDVVWYLYDAVSGERFELRDVACPLKTVRYVFDNENIWVNVQSSLDCESVAFDFTRSSDWQPVFDKSIFVMKQPIVSDAALYSAPVDVSKLRQDIEDKLRSKVQKWRSHMKTVWNRYCSGLLREMLWQWEYWSFNQTDSKPGYSQKLKQLMVTYKMFGFPLNTSYSNTKSIVSAIKSTCVHMNDDPIVEFGLAVEVYAYPNNVVSVWVFFAGLIRI